MLTILDAAARGRHRTVCDAAPSTTAAPLSQVIAALAAAEAVMDDNADLLRALA